VETATTERDEVRTRLLDARLRFPLVIEPEARRARDAAWLAGWLRNHAAYVEAQLVEHGALLLRGFEVRTPQQFEDVARAVSSELKNDYLGTSPRDALSPYTFSASELPPYYPIPAHCEMSFTKRPPRRLFFCCLVPNAAPGGETPLVDFRGVWRDLDPEVRARFEAKGVRNIRNYVGPQGGSRFDLWKLKRWDEMFQTTDRTEVERKCAENGFEATWKSEGRLALINTQPAMKRHPKSGVPVWFNHTQVFHLDAAASEYRRVAARLGKKRYLALGKFAALAVALKRRFVAADDQAMHCTFGDGSPISSSDIESLYDAIWRNMVAFPWQRGDVTVIDNDAVAHGRMPYSGPRRIAVAWS
jgi:alpha-ketoglutarate-dependent taurine dioxygenase